MTRKTRLVGAHQIVIKLMFLLFQRLGTELKTEVGGYIFAKLGLSGLVTGVQTFQDKRVTEAPLGNNVIGILPGTR